jgi:hypothetical protein
MDPNEACASYGSSKPPTRLARQRVGITTDRATMLSWPERFWSASRNLRRWPRPRARQPPAPGLSSPGRATVLVIEDVHWADEATLDVLRYLVRRMSSLSAALVLTYRDDEISGGHPVQQLLGLISRTERVRRLPLARLSKAAVRQLSAGSGLDSRDVYGVTSGNPFFVTELIAADDSTHLPPTIVDVVLACMRAVDPATQDAVEQLAVVPSALDRWLLDRVAPGGVWALETAERHGLVTITTARVSLRHQLIRRAIADSMPAARRIQLNQRGARRLAGARRGGPLP